MDAIYVCAGQVGYLIEVQPKLLKNLVDAQYAKFTK